MTDGLSEASRINKEADNKRAKSNYHYHGNTEQGILFQSQISDFDDSIMTLIWVSYIKYEEEKDKWEIQIFKQYPTVNTINHIDEERAVIGTAQRTESD